MEKTKFTAAVEADVRTQRTARHRMLRAEFIKAAMQGLASNPNTSGPTPAAIFAGIAVTAVVIADLTLQELERTDALHS